MDRDKIIQVTADYVRDRLSGEATGHDWWHIERVRVLVGSPSGADASTIAHSIENAKAELESSGWDRILSVEEDEELVYVFAVESGGRIQGVTVLVNDGAEEIVLVNIVGDIDPRVLGRAIASMDEIPNLEGFMNAVE